jgi:hypothetical protein
MMQPDSQPSALELLADQQARGLHLCLRPNSRLGVGPKHLVTADLNQLITARRDDLIFALAAKDDAPAAGTPEASETVEPIDLASEPLMDLLMRLRNRVDTDPRAQSLVDAIAGRLAQPIAPEKPPLCDHTKFAISLKNVLCRLQQGFAGTLTQEMVQEIIDELRAAEGAENVHG